MLNFYKFRSQFILLYSVHRHLIRLHNIHVIGEWFIKLIEVDIWDINQLLRLKLLHLKIPFGQHARAVLLKVQSVFELRYIDRNLTAIIYRSVNQVKFALNLIN